MFSPGGRPVCVKVRGSPSKSAKAPLISIAIRSASAFPKADSGVTVGASFAAPTVTVTVDVELPPCPSLIT